LGSKTGIIGSEKVGKSRAGSALTEEEMIAMAIARSEAEAKGISMPEN
jgi:hypothetical protein